MIKTLGNCKTFSVLFSNQKPRSLESVTQQRAKHYFPFMKPYYKDPFYPVRGSKQFLYDQNGKQYIDLMAGISVVNVGHSHPRISQVYERQASKLLHISQIYMHENQGEYCKQLCQELGPEYNSVYLCNSGGQANDYAMMLARLFTGRNTIYSFRNGYHGNAGITRGLTNVLNWNAPQVRNIQNEKLAIPYFYRSPHQSVETLLKDAEQHLETTSNGAIAAFIAESVLGAGGIMPLPDGYLPRLYQLIRKYKGLCISDQVQTGFGRIGKQTWAFKWQQVKPDIIITAKAIANGYPMAAVITRKQIMDSLNVAFFNTFGGGPLQCQLGMEVLKILKQQKLPQNAEKVGNYLMGEFKRIQQNNRLIGDIRGKGLMIGVQLVKDKITKEPATNQNIDLIEMCKNDGVLFGKSGPYGNVIRILAPLCISMNSAQKVIQTFERNIKKI